MKYTFGVFSIDKIGRASGRERVVWGWVVQVALLCVAKKTDRVQKTKPTNTETDTTRPCT